MKAMKAHGAAMTKGALAEALATQMDLKKSVCGKVIGTLAEIGAGEVKSTGIFILPGLCRIKTRVKPATKAGKKMMFGKEVVVKVKPATKAGKKMMFGKEVVVKVKPATKSGKKMMFGK